MSRIVRPSAQLDPRYIEEGEALQQLTGRTTPPAARSHKRPAYDVIVVGAGQAGLSTGHFLARAGLRFLILEVNDRVGDTWRNRWDSLRLFTPARFDGLPGMPFPAPRTYFPTKDEMANYLERYAARFDLPVKTGTRVRRLSRDGDRYVVATDDGDLEAGQVIVAMANYQQPQLPDYASELGTDIVQLHSRDYCNPSQLRDGPVLIVGAGNSGAEIAKELASHHQTWLSGRHTGHLPFRTDSLPGRTMFVPLVLRVVFHRLLTINTPIGRKLRPKIVALGGPLIRIKPKHLATAGVRRVPRMSGVQGGLPQLDDGQVLDVANVIWCTGFHPGFSWIDLPLLDETGSPRHRAGIVDDAPGLYFVGMHFLYSLSSAMIHGVGRDAERIAGIAATVAEQQAMTAVNGNIAHER